MRFRLGVALALTALSIPAAATAAGTFVVVDDAQPAALPSASAPNVPGQIAVDQNFTTGPFWVQQRSPEELQQIWQQAGATYSIPWQVLAAINKIESNFGANMGPSSAGAVGWMQFMPDTWLRWGVDADGDGVADPWNAEDAIYAAARYLAASGGATDISRALFSYNHAGWYVGEVLALANAYAGGTIDVSAFGWGPTPSVDVTALEQQVAEAKAALTRAEATEQRLAPVVSKASARVDRTLLLSDKLLAQKRLTIVGVRYDRTHALASRLRKQLVDAQAALDRARTGLFATPFQFGATSSSTFGWPDRGYVAGGTGDGQASTAVSFALSQLGTPYRWGGEGPDAFDCSGLVQAAYQVAGIDLPRVAQQQFDAGPHVAPGDPLQPGDLVYFGSDAAHIEHVGIVGGSGLMIDAPFTGAVVRFDSYERSSYVGATRPAFHGIAAPSTASVFEVVPDSPSAVFAVAPDTPSSPTTGEIQFTTNS